MKVYYLKYKYLLAYGIVPILGGLIIFFDKSITVNEHILMSLIFLMIGLSYPFILSNAIVITEEGISTSNVFFNKIIRTHLFIKWKEIENVMKFSDNIIFVIPKIKISAPRRLRLKELIVIRKSFKDYKKIVQELIRRVDDAKIDSSILEEFNKVK